MLNDLCSELVPTDWDSPDDHRAPPQGPALGCELVAAAMLRVDEAKAKGHILGHVGEAFVIAEALSAQR